MMLIVSILIIGALSSPFVRGHGVPIVISPGLNLTNPSHPPVDCNNITTGISTSCYADLNETSYLVDWNETYRLETCAPTQLWSTCFLNLAYTNNTRQTITRANITAHDCSSLDGNSSTNGCPPPPANATLFTSRSYYAVLNIYNVQHHIFVWAQAINASASLPGIAAIAAQAVPTTPNSLLQSIIREFGINQAADDALVNLLDTPSIRPTPQIVNGVSGGPQHPLDAAETVPLMVNRLADVLLLAMRNFDVFLGVVKNGSYSTNDLALVGELVTVLRGTP